MFWTYFSISNFILPFGTPHFSVFPLYVRMYRRRWRWTLFLKSFLVYFEMDYRLWELFFYIKLNYYVRNTFFYIRLFSLPLEHLTVLSTLRRQRWTLVLKSLLFIFQLTGVHRTCVCIFNFSYILLNTSSCYSLYVCVCIRVEQDGLYYWSFYHLISNGPGFIELTFLYQIFITVYKKISPSFLLHCVYVWEETKIDTGFEVFAVCLPMDCRLSDLCCYIKFFLLRFETLTFLPIMCVSRGGEDGRFFSNLYY